MTTAAKRYLDVRYSAHARPVTSYPMQLAEYLATHHLPPPGARVLDLGCGRGEFGRAFASLGYQVRGIDRARFGGDAAPTEPRASEGHSEPVPWAVDTSDFVQAALPYEAGSFDVVFSKSVFEHVADLSPLLEECLRVLVPGGRLIALVPDWHAQWRHFYDDWTHVRPFTLTGLRECLECHGFRTHLAQHFRQLPLLWRHPILRPLADAAALLPDACKRWKWVRFSKEWMLLVVADKPDLPLA